MLQMSHFTIIHLSLLKELASIAGNVFLPPANFPLGAHDLFGQVHDFPTPFSPFVTTRRLHVHLR